MEHPNPKHKLGGADGEGEKDGQVMEKEVKMAKKGTEDTEGEADDGYYTKTELAAHPPIEDCPDADDECMYCGVRACPHGEPLHFHHDGCPACYQDADYRAACHREPQE